MASRTTRSAMLSDSSRDTRSAGSVGIGLVLFFVVAVAVHLRAHAHKSLPSPPGFLALAIAALVCTVIR